MEEAFENCCRAVQVLALERFKPIVLAVLPLYVPEKVRVPLVAVRSPRFEPREIPEILELVRPVLLRVPETVGVNVRAPADGTIVCPRVRPLKERVEVEKVIAVAVVDAKPEPRVVMALPAPLTQTPPMA